MHTTRLSILQAANVGDSNLAATWSETGRVHIWDLTERLADVDRQSAVTAPATSSQPALYTFSGHQSEGYALDWSNTCPGSQSASF